MLSKLLISFIRFYQKNLSPIIHRGAFSGCRYSPTCSEYAIQAVNKFGLIKGIFLSCWRVMRCHPFAKGGFDPVPGLNYKEVI
ncbi:MAG: membrane protein insertion efficiency factor YidD [Candidatus Margulisiibacteriota bacterium]|nr:membrane protein insertion efficiency factor YidD [Candidatus Margulisiibacteriota bacterium]